MYWIFLFGPIKSFDSELTMEEIKLPTTVNTSNYPARACASRELCDRGWCPFICMYICMYVCDQNSLNGTLAVDKHLW